jgi:hypothetical protein
MITDLQPHERFVFGSNLGGHHYGGAAAQAYSDFGAQWGVAEGITGSSYAFPTLDAELKQMPMHRLKVARDKLYGTAIAHPELTFLLTKVGCGIAGYSEDEMRELFSDAPTNVRKPEGW